MSVVLSRTANEYVKDAMILLGLLGSGEEPKANEYTDGRRILNLMVKSFQSKGFMWKRSLVTLTLTPGTASYTIGPSATIDRVRPLRVVHAFRATTNADIPLEIISWSEYQDLPNKTQQGPPVKCFYDPQLTQGVFYLWYTGDTANPTVKITVMDPVDLFDSASDTADFPDEWVEPLTYNLAMRLAPVFGMPVPQEIAAIAVGSLAEMTAFDSETASIQIMPERY